MTTVINNPGDDGSSGAGWFVAIVLVVIILVAFFIYGLPMLRGPAPSNNPGATVNVQLPSGNSGVSGSGSGQAQ